MSSGRAGPSAFLQGISATFFMSKKERIAELSKTWIEFFDRFCIELADRVENPAKLFGTFGSKCKASAAGEAIVHECLMNLGDLRIAIDNRRTIHKARSAELNAALDKIISFIPAGSVVSGKNYDRLPNSMCKFVLAAVQAISTFVAGKSETELLPVRLHGLRKNTASTNKLNYTDNLLLGRQLSDVLGCSSPEEKAEVARLLASASAAVSARARQNLPKFEDAPTHEIRFASSAAAASYRRKSTSSETRRRRATSAAAKRKSSSGSNHARATRRNRA